MRLLDVVSQTLHPLLAEAADGALFQLPSPQHIASDVRAAPLRYVLDSAVAEFAASLAFLDTERLLSCLDLARAPAHRLWVEWNDAERGEVLLDAGVCKTRVLRRRVGMLVKSDASGRRGVVQVAWAEGDDAAVLSPIEIVFDLDNPDALDRDRAGNVLMSRAVFAEDGVLAGRGALATLYSLMRFRMRAEWVGYYRHQKLTPERLRECMHANCKCVAAEFPFLLGFLLALAARNAVSVAPVDLSKLNRTRARRGKADLLEHADVSVWLGAGASGAAHNGAAARAQARQHFVSGHLVRRGEQIFWRRSHLRGNPERGRVQWRNITLRMASGF